MNNVSKNQVNAIRATIQFCVNHADATKGIPAFAVALQTASNKLLLIDQLDQLASATTKGVTLDTNALRLSMELQAFKCASAIIAYATSVKNNTLKASVNFTKAKMEKMRKDEVDDTCQTIIEASQKYFDNVKNFGIDENDVNDLKTTISLYRTSVQNPRQAIIARADANKQIKELIREILETIFKGVMDAMVRTLEKLNPSFVTQYFFAREILDLGKGSQTIAVALKPEVSKTIYRVISGGKFVNTGKTTLIYCADHLPPCDMGDDKTVVVKAGETSHIRFGTNEKGIKPNKVHFITVTNIDKATSGSCTVKVTSDIPVKE